MPVHKVVMATWAENKRATNKDGGKYRGCVCMGCVLSLSCVTFVKS